jgi:hypothetical protein
MVTVLLFVLPHEFVACAQYCVVDAGETLMGLPGAAGVDVLPDAPTYH